VLQAANFASSRHRVGTPRFDRRYAPLFCEPGRAETSDGTKICLMRVMKRRTRCSPMKCGIQRMGCVVALLYGLTVILYAYMRYYTLRHPRMRGCSQFPLCIYGRPLHTFAATAIPNCCSDKLPGANPGRHSVEGSFVALCTSHSASLDLATALHHLFSLILFFRLRICSSRA